MRNDRTVEKQKARQMRREGQSIKEIAKKLEVARSCVSVWVRDIELSPNQREFLVERQKQFVSDLNRQGGGGSQHNRKVAIQQRLAYQQEGREYAKRGEPLHRIGCMLYWAEGAKHRNRIIFVNSDPNMMVIFIRFLRQCLHVSDEKMRLKLHCHTDDVESQNAMKKFWLEKLGFKSDCFGKVIVTPGSKIRNNRLENGICTVYLGSTQLTMHIFGAIQEYTGIEKPEWLFPNSIKD